MVEASGRMRPRDSTDSHAACRIPKTSAVGFSQGRLCQPIEVLRALHNNAEEAVMRSIQAARSTSLRARRCITASLHHRSGLGALSSP